MISIKSAYFGNDCSDSKTAWTQIHITLLFIVFQIYRTCVTDEGVLEKLVSFTAGLKTTYLEWECAVPCNANAAFGRILHEIDIWVAE